MELPVLQSILHTRREDRLAAGLNAVLMRDGVNHLHFVGRLRIDGLRWQDTLPYPKRSPVSSGLKLILFTLR